ncbi:unnamed protein product [Ixodes hexagonus]
MRLYSVIIVVVYGGQAFPQADDHLLAKASNVLGLNILRDLSAGRPNINVFFSPASISAALGMVYAGARGASEAELLDVIGLKVAGLTDRGSVLSEYRKQLNDTPTGSVTLEVANAALVSNELRVLEEYKRELINTFGAEFRSADFARGGSEVASEMNRWVSQKTHGKIPQVFGAGLPLNTMMLLLNAFYFKGSWLTEFSPKNTVAAPFYNRGTDVVEKSTVKMRSKLRHAGLADLDAAAAELPYKGGRFSMVIVLPNAKTGLAKLREGLSVGKLEEIDGLLKLKTVNLAFPKFKLEQEYNLVPTLRRLGLLSVFGDGADLSGVTGDTGLLVSDVKHKAMVEVNEEGTVAAAVTAARSRLKSLPRIANFLVDRPFMFYIRDKVTRRILFLGEVHAL